MLSLPSPVVIFLLSIELLMTSPTAISPSIFGLILAASLSVIEFVPTLTTMSLPETDFEYLTPVICNVSSALNP